MWTEDGSYATTGVAVRLGASARGTRSTRRRRHIGAAGPLGLGAGPAGGTHGHPGGAGRAPFAGAPATHGTLPVAGGATAAAGGDTTVWRRQRPTPPATGGTTKTPAATSPAA